MRRSCTKTTTRLNRRFLPRLETLESRWCPSIAQSGHSLSIQGDGSNDMITIRDNGVGGITASISSIKGTQTVSATGITSIAIDAGGGSNTITDTLTAVLAESETVMLCLGKGSSQATFDYSAGLNNATLAVNIGAGAGSSQVTTQFGTVNGSRVNMAECLATGAATARVHFGGTVTGSLVSVNVNGGSGIDQVFAQLGNMVNSNLQFHDNLGKGANLFDLEASGNLQNAVAHFDIDPGFGSNTIVFNAKGLNIDTTSRLNLESGSGAGADNVTLNYSGQMKGELSLNLQGGPGNDTMSATLTLAKGSTGRVHGLVSGGDGDDTLSFRICDNSNPAGKSTLSLLDALLDGGSGHNTLNATPNVKVRK